MACKMTCNSYGMLWPLPTGRVELSEELIHLLPGDINIAVAPADAEIKQEPFTDKVNTMIGELRNIFREYLYMMHPKYKIGSGINPFPSGMFNTFQKRICSQITAIGFVAFPTVI